MDIKNCPEKYEAAVGMNAEFKLQNAELIKSVKQSASLLMQGRVDFEFRTTLMKELHTSEDMEAIGLWLRGPAKLFLQTYREEGDLIIGGFTPFTRGETEALLATLRKYLPNAEIRE
jgi:pyruvate formate lyase activating enzyme